MENLTEEQLIKRAKHAGRNLSVLASLASVVALGLIAVAFMGNGPGSLLVGLLGVSIGVIASAYWVLSVAAYRGDPKAAGIVIVVAGVVMVLNLGASGISSARTGDEFKLDFRGIIMPLLVVWALASSRKVLLQLQENGSWEKVFAPAKPTARLCLIGMMLLISGMLAVIGGGLFAGLKAGKQRSAAVRSAKTFTQVLNREEKQFLEAMNHLSSDQQNGGLEVAWTKLNSLEARINAMKADPESAKISPVLNIYGNAVRSWKKGVSLLKEPKPDTDQAFKILEVGDKFRVDAYQEFNHLYATRPQTTAL
jgi:hypothetical protein